MSGSSTEKELKSLFEGLLTQLQNIQSNIHKQQAALKKISETDQIIQILENLSNNHKEVDAIQELVKTITITHHSDENNQMLWVQINSLFEPIRKDILEFEKECQQKFRSLQSKSTVKTQEGIIGEPKPYYDGLNYVPVKDDGNCFYYAVAASLNAAGTDHYNQQILRDKVADFFGDKVSTENPMTAARREKKELLSSMLVAQAEDKYGKEFKEINEQLELLPFLDTEAERQRIKASLNEQLAILHSQRVKGSTITVSKIKEYADKMRTTEWADETSMGALSELLNRPIVVVTGLNTDKPIIRRPIHGEDKSGSPIFVHFNGKNHYNALIVQPGYSSREILRSLALPKHNRSPVLHSSKPTIANDSGSSDGSPYRKTQKRS